MTNDTKKPLACLADEVRTGLDYSRNFATAKPNIGNTEKEHILGLCNLLERLLAEHDQYCRMFHWATRDLCAVGEALGIPGEEQEGGAGEFIEAIGQLKQVAAGVVPDGYVLMPKALTAENGAKSLLAGEFSVPHKEGCHWCDCTGGEPEEPCEHCDGTGEVTVQAPVDWNTIKAIYAKAVEELSAAPTPPAGQREIPVAVQDEREAFEAWQRKDGWERPDDAGEWEAWQARAMLADVPTPPAFQRVSILKDVPVRYSANAGSTAVNPDAPLPGTHSAPTPPAQQSQWIDVVDQLPGEAQEVLFVRGGKTVHGAWIGGIFWHNNEKCAAPGDTAAPELGDLGCHEIEQSSITAAPAQAEQPDTVPVPREELERTIQVLRYAAHPMPSPHAERLAKLLEAGQ